MKTKREKETGKPVENNVYVNIEHGDLVDTFTVTAAEFAERYADYEVLSDETGDDGSRSVTLRGKE